jgi:F-box/leucine-rich repeat protein 10/11
MEGASVVAYDHDPVGFGPSNQLQEESHAEAETSLDLTYASPPAFHAESVDVKDPNSMSVSSKPTTSLVSPPTSLADELDVTQDGEALTSVESEAPTLHTPNSSSRHSSRQPRHGERLAPETVSSRPSIPAPRPAPTAMRRTTPGPLPPSTKKPSSRPSSSHTKKSSPMVEKRFERHMASSLSPNQTSKHMKGLIIDEENTDAESLRLIRELQEEEFGLRKRSTRS